MSERTELVSWKICRHHLWGYVSGVGGNNSALNLAIETDRGNKIKHVSHISVH